MKCSAQPSSDSQLAKALVLVCGISTASIILAGSVHAEQMEHTVRATRQGSELFSLAENEDFWANALQYVRFFISVLVRYPAELERLLFAWLLCAAQWTQK